MVDIDGIFVDRLDMDEDRKDADCDVSDVEEILVESVGSEDEIIIDPTVVGTAEAVFVSNTDVGRDFNVVDVCKVDECPGEFDFKAGTVEFTVDKGSVLLVIEKTNL